MVDHTDIALTVKIEATRWVNDEDDFVRIWDGPHTDDDENEDDEPNLAACVTQTRAMWPFNKWKWRVWSPFGSESAASGNAGSANEAMRKADEALLLLISEVA